MFTNKFKIIFSSFSIPFPSPHSYLHHSGFHPLTHSSSSLPSPTSFTSPLYAFLICRCFCGFLYPLWPLKQIASTLKDPSDDSSPGLSPDLSPTNSPVSVWRDCNIPEGSQLSSMEATPTQSSKMSKYIRRCSSPSHLAVKDSPIKRDPSPTPYYRKLAATISLVDKELQVQQELRDKIRASDDYYCPSPRNSDLVEGFSFVLTRVEDNKLFAPKVGTVHIYSDN